MHCFLHFRENIQSELQQLSIPNSVIEEYRIDIFGNSLQLKLGLVNAESESELDAKLTSLESVWNDCGSQFHFPPEFHSWFKLYSHDVIVKSMLCPIREKAGSGSPPLSHTTQISSSQRLIFHTFPSLCTK